MFYNISFQSSIPSSQISSWSIENNIHCNSLDALQIICDGKISPIKYQIRKDLDDLKPRTLRSLKRKATVAVQETLDILAPSQAKKVWQLIDQEMVCI